MKVFRAHRRTAVVSVSRSDIGVLMDGIAAALGETEPDYRAMSQFEVKEFRREALRRRWELWAVSDAMDKFADAHRH